MFHYVRPADATSFPRLQGFFLHEFTALLDALVSGDGIVDPQSYLAGKIAGLPRSNGSLLTFDDGLQDHYRWVFPELKKRGLSGLFFVSSGSLERLRLLRVHKVHALYGAKGYDWLREAFLRLAHPDGHVPEVIYSAPRALKAYPYDDELTSGFKYALNYLLPQDEVEEILGQILSQSFDERFLAEEFYLSPDQIREMSAAGMVFGYHGHTHTPFSRLTEEQLETEMLASKELLSPLLPQAPSCLSYPYGDASSVTIENVTLLRNLGIKAAFLAENDGTPQDVFYLPRIDCAEWRRQNSGRRCTPTTTAPERVFRPAEF
jgi:peptidoglycan/xylan/chitin deacetylase (PgdA/CDA1 family)